MSSSINKQVFFMGDTFVFDLGGLGVGFALKSSPYCAAKMKDSGNVVEVWI